MISDGFQYDNHLFWKAVVALSPLWWGKVSEECRLEYYLSSFMHFNNYLEI